jgi:hypothetical protein
MPKSLASDNREEPVMADFGRNLRSLGVAADFTEAGSSEQ